MYSVPTRYDSFNFGCLVNELGNVLLLANEERVHSSR